MKPYRVEYVQLAGWEENITGLWLAENEDWLLLRYIPVDYVVDGYALIAKTHIADRGAEKKYQQVAQVLKLKGIKAEVPAGFQFAGLPEIFRWLEQQYGLVHFYDEEQSAFLGWVNESDAVHFWLDSLEPRGTVAAREADEPPFELAAVQIVCFADDYSESLKLLWQHKQRRKLLKTSDN
jgi:hypothetical protein